MHGQRAAGGSHARRAGAAAPPGQGTAGARAGEGGPAGVPPPADPLWPRPGAWPGSERGVGSGQECPGQERPVRPRLPARFFPASRRVPGGLDCAETAFNLGFLAISGVRPWKLAIFLPLGDTCSQGLPLRDIHAGAYQAPFFC